jgi:hypothetical protein
MRAQRFGTPPRRRGRRESRAVRRVRRQFGSRRLYSSHHPLTNRSRARRIPRDPASHPPLFLRVFPRGSHPQRRPFTRLGTRFSHGHGHGGRRWQRRRGDPGQRVLITRQLPQPVPPRSTFYDVVSRTASLAHHVLATSPVVAQQRRGVGTPRSLPAQIPAQSGQSWVEQVLLLLDVSWPRAPNRLDKGTQNTQNHQNPHGHLNIQTKSHGLGKLSGHCGI